MLSVLLTLTVGLRHLDPTIACVAATVVCTLSLALDAPLGSTIAGAVATILLAWSVAVNGSRWGWAALTGLLVAVIAQAHLYLRGSEAIDFLAFALGAVSGHLWAERSRVERAALAQAAELREESDEHIQIAVRAERLRIARELHDVASHAVGVMVLQAGAAHALRGRDDTAARTAIKEIQQAGDAALAELKVLAQVLDPPGASPSDSMWPVNSAVEAVIDRLRSGGMTVTATVPDLADTDPAVAGSVHRIIQESLTNVLRHAPGSSVQVTVHHGADTVEVQVRDTGPADPTHPTGGGGGFGLIGLAERPRTRRGPSRRAAPRRRLCCPGANTDTPRPDPVEDTSRAPPAHHDQQSNHRPPNGTTMGGWVWRWRHGFLRTTGTAPGTRRPPHDR